MAASLAPSITGCWSEEAPAAVRPAAPPVFFEGRSGTAWLADLGSRDVPTRRAAIRAFEQLGAPGLPLLAGAAVRTLPDDPAALIAALAPHGAGAVPVLVQLLESDDPDVLVPTLEAVRVVGDDAGGAVPAVIALLDREHAELEQDVRAALRAIGEDAIPALVDLVREAPPVVSDDDEPLDPGLVAAQLLGAVRDGGPEALGRLLRSDDDLVVTRALRGLMVSRDGAAVATGEVLRLLAEDRPSERGPLYEVLARIASKRGPTVMPVLVDQLSGGDVDRVIEICEVLAAIGKEASAAREALGLLVSDPSPLVRLAALEALASVGFTEAERGAIAGAFADPDPEVRRAAARVVVRDGVDASAFLPQVVETIHWEGDWATQRAVDDALDRLDLEDTETRRGLLAVINDPDPARRTRAAVRLAWLGLDDAPVVDALAAAAIEDPRLENGELRSALAQLGPAGVPVLAAALDPECRCGPAGVVSALGAVGPAASDAIPALLGLLTGASDYLRIEIAGTLEDIEPGSGRHVYAEVATKGSPFYRGYALQMLADHDGAEPLLSALLVERVAAEVDRDERAGLLAAARQLDAPPRELRALANEFLDDPSHGNSARQVLMKMGPEVDGLVAGFLEDPDLNRRREAAVALARRESNVEWVTREVVAWLDEDDSDAASTVNWTLEDMDHVAPGPIAELLLDRDPARRAFALEKIRELELEGPELRAAVEAAVRDERRSVRQAAESTLRSLHALDERRRALTEPGAEVTRAPDGLVEVRYSGGTLSFWE